MSFYIEYNKQSVEEILVRRAVRRTIPILYVKGLFDNYANADEVLKHLLQANGVI